AIVVIESIHRRREKGDSRIRASVSGARIVGGAVTASTLTTIVVFFPIVFVRGIAGQVFGDMALTVIIALSVSLIVALFFLPMLLTLGGDRSKEPEENIGFKPTKTPVIAWNLVKTSFIGWRKQLKTWQKILSALFFFSYLLVSFILIFLFRLTLRLIYYLLLAFRWLFHRVLTPVFSRIATPSRSIGSVFRQSVDRFTVQYSRLMKVLLKHPGIVLVLSAVLCFISFWVLLPRLGGELIPGFSQGTINFELTLPVGTPLEETAKIVEPVERKLTDLPDVKKVSSRIGGETMSAESSTQGPNSAVITVMLKPGGDLDGKERLIIEEVRNTVRDIPALELLVTHPTLFTFKQPIEVILKGNDLAEVRRRGLAVESRLSELPMLTDVESTVRPGHPEVVILFDRDRLARLGISAREAAERVRSAVLGEVPTRFREEERRIDIRVQLAEADRQSLSKLEQLVINPDQPVPVTLSEVAKLELREGPSEIKRVGGARAAVITADLQGSDLKSADAAITGELLGMGLNEGYDFDISGQNREMEDSLASLRFALLLAVFLVYVVMASQFESLKYPFLILITIPLAVACVIPLLWFLEMPLSVMVFLGLIVLAGIVVNDSIILVDYTNKMRQKGMKVKDAILEAGRARLRPILMTTLTTVLALLPMALGVGEGVEIRRPMAVTVIFGLSFSTLITLIVIPLLYSLVTSRSSETD
ncbi:efflux RND transporter permease subunit, partial [bacterium]|nr:efflux RND transporter permease subunit [bacterium]